jgi:esterase/lipase superfamily enzyme
MKVPMRVSSLLALFLSSALLAGCVGLGEETGATGAVTPGGGSSTAGVAGGSAAAAAPIGLWRGGLTMLVMTTRDRQGSPLREPWFGSNRAGDPTAAKAILYPPSKSMLASVNPIASSDWTVAGADVLAGATPAQGLALQAEGRDVLVYVHGFHETFDSAATSYAKLVAGINFTGAPVLFTWPSRGALLDYVADRESAMWSRDALEETLTSLATNPRVGRIHLLAHSMGGILALESLRSIADRSGGLLGSRFGAIVLANPDVDVDLFKRQMKRLAPLAPRMTVIVSAKDRALNISSKIAGGLPRVGSADRGAIEETGVKVVDATDFGSGWINHDIFMSRQELHGVLVRAMESAAETQ